MIKNLVFDYGAVLVDWNPHHYYDKYFGSAAKADWFLENICTYEWNIKQDNGRPIREAEEELISKHPEWEKEILMYYGKFTEMMGGELPGMEDCLKELKKSYHIFGLSNWSAETFAIAEPMYPIFKLMEDMVISGREGMIKPHKEIFELAIKRFGINPSESIFIDDKQENVDGARECGFHGIRFQNREQMLREIAELSKR